MLPNQTDEERSKFSSFTALEKHKPDGAGKAPPRRPGQLHHRLILGSLPAEAIVAILKKTLS